MVTQKEPLFLPMPDYAICKGAYHALSRIFVHPPDESRDIPMYMVPVPLATLARIPHLAASLSSTPILTKGKLKLVYSDQNNHCCSSYTT